MAEDTKQCSGSGIELAYQSGYHAVGFSQCGFVSCSQIILKLSDCFGKTMMLRKTILCLLDSARERFGNLGLGLKGILELLEVFLCLKIRAEREKIEKGKKNNG